MIDQKKKSLALQPGCVPECPGCAHKYLTRHQSLTQKEQWLKKRLSRWAAAVDPIRSAEDKSRWGYRNKVCLSTQWKNEHWQFGLIKHETVIPIHDCPVHTRQIQDSVSLFAGILPSSQSFPLAYFVVAGNQITLVLKSKQMPDVTWLDDSFVKKLKYIGIEGVWLHLHPCVGKKIFAKNTWHLLYGSKRSIDASNLLYGPRAFQQLIPALYNQALSAAETFLKPSSKSILIDLYCGIGAGLALWERQCNHIIGVELDAEAVECAGNNTKKAVTLRGKCKDRIPQMIHWTDAHLPDKERLLYVNPPRTGLEPETLEWIAGIYKPDRMVYLSCSAGTLHRDLLRLETSGLEVIKISPYDFFPQTLHVETMVFLKSSD